MKIPLIDLGAQHATIRDEVMAAAREIIERQSFVLGEPVAKFERTLAALVGGGFAVGVASGTDALVLALRALGVGPGDAVLTPALTFIASVEAVVTAGATPVFVDVDPDTLTMDPADARARLAWAERSGLRVKGILPVHLFGRCAAMEELCALARARGLLVVEDAAQAIGARGGAGRVGALGDAAAFSFFPSKNLGAWGDGGAVTTHDAKVAARIRSLRQHGRVATDGDDVFGEHGVNSRLDALQAAVLEVKARHLPGWNEARRAVADRYRSLLGGLRDVTLPSAPADPEGHAYHLFVIRTTHRDALAAHLGQEGITARAYYARPAHRQPAYARFFEDQASLVHTDAASRELLALPMFAEMTDGQVQRVAASVLGFFATTG